MLLGARAGARTHRRSAQRTHVSQLLHPFLFLGLLPFSKVRWGAGPPLPAAPLLLFSYPLPIDLHALAARLDTTT